jgi:hypothetical protein
MEGQGGGEAQGFKEPKKPYYMAAQRIPDKCVSWLLTYTSLLVGCSVTRYVCEKIAQNVAQPIFVRINQSITCIMEKYPENLRGFSDKKSVRSKQLPQSVNFAQSGHAGWQSGVDNGGEKIELLFVPELRLA